MEQELVDTIGNISTYATFALFVILGLNLTLQILLYRTETREINKEYFKKKVIWSSLCFIPPVIFVICVFIFS